MAARPQAGPGDRLTPCGHKPQRKGWRAACIRRASVDRSPRKRGAIGARSHEGLSLAALIHQIPPFLRVAEL